MSLKTLSRLQDQAVAKAGGLAVTDAEDLAMLDVKRTNETFVFEVDPFDYVSYSVHLVYSVANENIIMHMIVPLFLLADG